MPGAEYQKHGLTFLSLGAVLVFAIVAGNVAIRGTLPWDGVLLQYVGRTRSGFLDSVMIWFSGPGFYLFAYFAPIGLALHHLAHRRLASARLLIFSISGAATASAVLKFVFGRSRPSLWVSPLPTHGFSFPSGHAMTAMAAAVAVLLTLGALIRTVVGPAAILFALIIGASRLYLGVHYPSDVLAGWAAGVALSCMLGLLLKTGFNAQPGHQESATYLTLREAFETTGEFFFRHRSLLPLVPLALILTVTFQTFSFPNHPESRLGWELFCLAITLTGLAIRISAVGFAPAGTSGRNTLDQRADELNTTGLYSVVRHPLYVGNLFMWIGAALFPGVWWLVAIVVLIFGFYYERIMLTEEEFLRREFGSAYLEWARTTPAFAVDLSRWKAPALRFSARTAARREMSGLLGAVSAFTALDALADYATTGVLRFDRVWSPIFMVGLSVFAALLILKKSKYLDVVGR